MYIKIIEVALVLSGDFQMDRIFNMTAEECSDLRCRSSESLVGNNCYQISGSKPTTRTLPSYMIKHIDNAKGGNNRAHGYCYLQVYCR